MAEDMMESVAASLQQRIGQLVSQYETDVAVIKANAAKQLQDKDEEIKSLREVNQELVSQVEVLKTKVNELEGTDVSAQEVAEQRDAPADED